ncbi:hypothetical protein K1719_003203 [Acacia pycnantha]|nr:hypothetical protein K1719_003203 [Acacia pycnantha]
MGMRNPGAEVEPPLLTSIFLATTEGISALALPYKRTSHSWLKISAQDVKDNICIFAKKGLTPSQIVVIFRDSHGLLNREFGIEKSMILARDKLEICWRKFDFSEEGPSFCQSQTKP